MAKQGLVTLAALLSGAEATFPLQGANINQKRSVFAVSNQAWESEIVATNSKGYVTSPLEFDVAGRRTGPTRTEALDDNNVWGVAAGRDGSVYLAGYTQVGAGSFDAFVAKYSAGKSGSGELAWSQLHGSPGIDDATSVASGSDGSVLLAGFTEGSLGGQTNHGLQDAFVAHYSANGTHLWTRLLGTQHRDEARAVSGGGDGSVVVAGLSEGGLGHDALGHRTSGGKDVFVAKLSNNGDLLWTQALATSSHDEAHLVAMHDDGSVIVAGYSSGEMNTSRGIEGAFPYDVFVARFSPEGRLSWLRQDIRIGVKLADHVRGGDAMLTALAFGGNGSVIIAGFTTIASFNGQTNRGGFDSFIVQYSATGEFMWSRLIGTESDDKAWAVASTMDGGVLLAGASQGDLEGEKNQGGWDAFVLRYSSSGKLVWVDLLGTAEDDEARAVVTSPERGELFLVAGYTKGALAAAVTGGREANNLFAGAAVSAAVPSKQTCGSVVAAVLIATLSVVMR